VTKSQKVRIISGLWRGRKLMFPAQSDVRPTLDRVRETMFAWCQHIVVGAHCLDVCAGSGAMGFEALSRGAASVVMLECDPRVVSSLQNNQQLLGADQAIIQRATVPCEPDLLGDRPFDLVFLDPPFDRHLHATILTWLASVDKLVDGAVVLCEWDLHHRPDFPILYDLLREKKSGQVGYGFLRYNQIRIEI
jgi:16S rRNA (guanine966-N2)-methyltransferase